MVVWHEETGETVSEDVWQFVNRLSDYMFVLSRFVSEILEINTSVWEK
jgi:cob(I)alamin adenosyltransferase